MVDFTSDVAAVRLGAACLAARPPWTSVAAAGADHALGQSPVLAAGRPDERRTAFRPALAQQATQQTRTAALVAAALLPMTVTVTRKPNFVHKTRINAGGYGAMGPHPGRERLA